MAVNLFHDYYRGYYDQRLVNPGFKEGHSERTIEKANKRWADQKLSPELEPAFNDLHSRLEQCATHYLEGTTTGDGFLADGGYAHQSWQSGMHDVQMGMAFDFTTGVPFLKGSSLKGILRSHMWPTGRWQGRDGKDGKDIDKNRQDLNSLLASTLESAHLGEQHWNKYLFEGGNPRKDQNQRLHPNQWVSYLGAATCYSNEHHFQIQDLAPQKTPIKKPIVLKFLSVRPGIKMRVYFSFPTLSPELHKSDIENILTMMAWHLAENGLGAKSSYGYGTLTNITLTSLRD